MTNPPNIGVGEDSDDFLCSFESHEEEPYTIPTDEYPTDTDELRSPKGTRVNNPQKSRRPYCGRPLVRKKGAKETAGSSTVDIIEL